MLIATGLILTPVMARALTDGSGDPAAVSSEDGKWTDKDGNPTFKIEPDGTVDWYTYAGFIRYSAECLRCHQTRLGMASNHCLPAGGKHVEPKHFRPTLACAETCRACAEVCEACARSREQVADMDDCVARRRRCAESCRKMAA